MDPLRLKQIIRETDFESPSEYLVSIQPLLAERGDQSLENDQLFVDKTSAAFLACGLPFFWGSDCSNQIATSFDDEGSDIDWIIKSRIHGQCSLISVQVKTHLKEFWSGHKRTPEEYHRFLEEQIIKLGTSYPDSADIVFTIHINKSVTLDITKLVEIARGLEFSGLFSTGRANPESSKYLIVGDLLDDLHRVEHHYFSLSSCGKILSENSGSI